MFVGMFVHLCVCLLVHGYRSMDIKSHLLDEVVSIGWDERVHSGLNRGLARTGHTRILDWPRRRPNPYGGILEYRI